MPDQEGELPSASSGPALKAEAGIVKLASSIAAAQSAEAMEEVVQRAEQLHRRLCAESDLRKALLEPKESAGEDGTPSWTHWNGVKTLTMLEMLQTRDNMMDTSLEKCAAEGVHQSILDEAMKSQKTLKAALKQAVAEDEERKAKEAAAAAKAAKKKKGGKKKK